MARLKLWRAANSWRQYVWREARFYSSFLLCLAAAAAGGKVESRVREGFLSLDEVSLEAAAALSCLADEGGGVKSDRACSCCDCACISEFDFFLAAGAAAAGELSALQIAPLAGRARPAVGPKAEFEAVMASPVNECCIGIPENKCGPRGAAASTPPACLFKCISIIFWNSAKTFCKQSGTFS
jgi:hypothetical protein